MAAYDRLQGESWWEDWRPDPEIAHDAIVNIWVRREFNGRGRIHTCQFDSGATVCQIVDSSPIYGPQGKYGPARPFVERRYYVSHREAAAAARAMRDALTIGIY
jgi:hypothetical protein